MTVRTISEAMIDQTLADSFPASDPPAWTLGLEPQSELNVAVSSSVEGLNNEPGSAISGVNPQDHEVLIRFPVPDCLLTLDSHY
ncbi:MAG: hypothetical protein ABI882_24525 [Acidobacteriota bacterium]